MRAGKTFLGRGMLGGLLGGAIWSIVAMVLGEYLHSGNIKAAFNYLYLLALPSFIALNILVGIVLGALTASGGIIGAMINYLIISDSYSFFWEAFLVRYGAIVGAVTGIICGAREHRLNSDSDV